MSVSKKTIPLIASMIIILVLGSYSLLLRSKLTTTQTELASAQKQLKQSENQHAATSNELDKTQQNLEDLQNNLVTLREELDNTKKELEDENARIAPVRELLGTVAEGVARQEKLASIDPELLQKYSRVYFLNENYSPSSLSAIPSEFSTKNEQFHTKALPFLNSLIADAKDEGIELYVASAYRSFSRQESLKEQYVVQYGSGANQFSADQGYSEHQLGTTVDFTTPGNGYSLEGFGDTDAFAWLQNNAYRYGFVLSYPEDNNYYQYEPWHWRFVGTELATYLENIGEYLYELDQRDLQKYRLNLFE